jgi:hypothetical protein
MAAIDGKMAAVEGKSTLTIRLRKRDNHDWSAPVRLYGEKNFMLLLERRVVPWAFEISRFMI